MSENLPERRLTSADFARMWSDPLHEEHDSEKLREFSEVAEADYRAALDRGDLRAIEDAEGRLTAFYDAHPELRGGA